MNAPLPANLDREIDLRQCALHYEDDRPTEVDTDDAAYFAGMARRRLYGIAGEEAGDPEGAHKLLLMAKRELLTALRYVEQAEERFAFAHGIGEGMNAAEGGSPFVTLFDGVSARRSAATA